MPFAVNGSEVNAESGTSPRKLRLLRLTPRRKICLPRISGCPRTHTEIDNKQSWLENELHKSHM